MIARATYLFWLFVLASAATLAQADAAALDGTLWMYEHESGSKHYVAFHGNYHYLNSSGSGDYDDALWLRSTLPYYYHGNFDGSISYCSTHVAAAAWAVNWGRFDVHSAHGSFYAAGMLCSLFIYNHNEPYQLVSTDWHPPVGPAGIGPAEQAFFIPVLFPTLFGQ